MRKLKLEMDALVVESFATHASGDAGRGTVDGLGGTKVDPSCGTCETWIGETCDASCGGTCDAGCYSWLTDCPLC